MWVSAKILHQYSAWTREHAAYTSTLDLVHSESDDARMCIFGSRVHAAAASLNYECRKTWTHTRIYATAAPFKCQSQKEHIHTHTNNNNNKKHAHEKAARRRELTGHMIDFNLKLYEERTWEWNERFRFTRCSAAPVCVCACCVYNWIGECVCGWHKLLIHIFITNIYVYICREQLLPIHHVSQRLLAWGGLFWGLSIIFKYYETKLSFMIGLAEKDTIEQISIYFCYVIFVEERQSTIYRVREIWNRWQFSMTLSRCKQYSIISINLPFSFILNII